MLYSIRPPHSYIKFAANYDVNGAQAFCRQLLTGSSMTNVFQHNNIPYKHVLDGEVKTFIDTILLRNNTEITIATTIKAAWALVLAEMADTNDVVFGSIVWGRNAAYPGVEHAAGACICNIPVRARLDHGMTRLVLLQQIQQQHADAAAFESFPYKCIVAECTDWKPWERLSTLVEYENLGEDTSRLELEGNGHLVVDEIRPPGDRHDVTIYSMPVGGQTPIALDYCEALIPQHVPQLLLDRLIKHIVMFHNAINGVLVVGRLKDLSFPRFPMSMKSELKDDKFAARTDELQLDEHSSIDIIVEEAWTSVLCASPMENITYRVERTPFYDVWSDLIAANGLATHHRTKGFEITVEDILEKPDMVSQGALLEK